MPQLNKGETFADGQQVTGVRLNNLVDGATILPGVITDQIDLTANTVASGDSVLLHDLSAGALREATASDLLNSNLPISTSSITGGSGVDLTITPAAGNKANVAGAFQVTGNSEVTGNQTLTGNLTVNGTASFNTNGIIKLPVGTTAQRPATPAAGDTRFNSTTSKLEFYNGTDWTLCVNNATGSISGMLLYDIHEENIAYGYGTVNGMVYWTSSILTKPANEIWVVESDFFYSSTGSGYFYWYNFALSTQYKSLYINSGSNQRTSGFVIGTGTTLTSDSFVLYRGAVGSSGSTVVQITLGNTAIDDNKLRIYKYKPA